MLSQSDLEVGALTLPVTEEHLLVAREGVVGAVVVDVRQGPEVGTVVREGALPVRFERSPGAPLGPWGRGEGRPRGLKGAKKTLTDTFGLHSAA